MCLDIILLIESSGFVLECSVYPWCKFNVNSIVKVKVTFEGKFRNLN